MDETANKLKEARDNLVAERINLAPSDRTRCLSVAITKIEEALLWHFASKGGLL